MSVIFIAANLVAPRAANPATITVINLDAPGEGFNDPSPADPASTAGGNGGASLGAQRFIAFQHAADIWGSLLSSPLEISIEATLDPLSCSSTSALLGQTTPRTAHINFVGAPRPNTWYTQALANSLAGTDLAPGINDMRAVFNSSIGTSCSFPLAWYYGLEANPPAGRIDFVTIVLHELAHGLGFVSLVDLTSGAKFAGFDDAFSLNLEDHSTGKLYPQMTDAERVSASQNTGNLDWVGANVAAASSRLTGGVHPAGHVQMYAPNPQQTGASVSHLDTAVTPNELMEPLYTGANHNLDLTLKSLADIGWHVNDALVSTNLVAAVLPSSRSVQTGFSATAFATIINAGSVTATGCGISPITSISATFSYQATDPATNQPTGNPNTPVDIAAGAARSFIISLTPSATIASTDVQFSFSCSNASAAPINSGLNTLVFSASATPIPDIVALAATLSNDGIANIPGNTATGVFAVATVNVGASGNITASADTGATVLPVNISLCQTNPVTGACLASPSSTVTTTINANATPTFGIFVQGTGNVAFNPATNRIFVRFKDAGNVTRGSTSVAVRTQ